MLMRQMMVACCLLGSPLLAAEEVSITIFHTNDIHQHIKTLPRIAGYVAAYREQDRNTVFVDAGDWFDRGSSLVTITRGEAIYGAMGQMGYDMWILGNHDWAYGGERLFELMRRYPVPVLGTNLGSSQPSIPSNVKEIIIKEFDGIRVGFFGITLDTYGKDPNRRPYFHVLDCHEKTAQAIAKLKEEQVDIIVAVTHLGLKKMKHEGRSTHPSDIDLAKAYPEIDIIIGGHSHTPIKEDKARALYEETGVVIVQTGGEGHTLGQLKLVVDSDTRAIENFEVQLIKVTDDLPEQEATAQFIEAQYKQHMPDAKTVIGEIEERLEFFNMAYWYADFLRKKSGADIVLMPRETLYDEHSSFKAEVLTVERLYGILYDRYLVKSTITGTELLRFCSQEKIRDRFNPFHDRGRPFSGDAFFYSGFEVQFNELTKQVEFSLDPNKNYTLVTPWPFMTRDLNRYRHSLPSSDVVDITHPFGPLKVENAVLLDQTTAEILIAEGLMRPLRFNPKYPKPLPEWEAWKEHYEKKR